MASRRPRFLPACPIGEALETRLALSTATLGAVQVAQAAHKAVATHTTLAVNAGTLGQPITLTATVNGPSSGAAPSGSIKFIDHGTVIATVPVQADSARPGTAQATATLTAQPGGPASFFGKYAVSAQFVPSAGFSKSVATKAFTINPPAFTTLSDGVKVATITPGTGAAIQAGQTANVLYTGYLKNGTIFDDSAQHNGTTFSFPVGAGQVVPGFDAGILGMQAGETRIVEIPASQGYGSTANGAIPANSTLIFVLNLQSIS